jgi:hypothetical protein
MQRRAVIASAMLLMFYAGALALDPSLRVNELDSGPEAELSIPAVFAHALTHCAADLVSPGLKRRGNHE